MNLIEKKLKDIFQSDSWELILPETKPDSLDKICMKS